MIEEDLFQAYTIGKENEWTEIIIPFHKFIATHRGFVEGQIDLDGRQIDSVGLLMAQRRDGPFRIEIKSIAAVNTDLYESKGKRWTGVSDDPRKD